MKSNQYPIFPIVDELHFCHIMSLRTAIPAFSLSRIIHENAVSTPDSLASLVDTGTVQLDIRIPPL